MYSKIYQATSWFII